MPRRSSTKSPPAEISLRIPSRFGYEMIAMEAAAALARVMGFPPARIEDLRTAVSEACINAIEHGNHFSPAKPVEIRLRPGPRTLKVSVQDHGCGFARGSRHAPDLQKKLAGEESPRGWGLFLIERLVDRVHFRTLARSGHVTTLTIHLRS